MYLKSLELHGFKSFPNRTVLTFERGATVIVGPNGSGKSNISDAMRWVLGELSSRNIRGTKMEDVIFGGTDSRRPMGFAEVSVTFDNSDPQNRLDSEYDEVTVTRRYFRTGESEYLINKQPKRLRDIYELFMNTGVGREGYSIIGQGKIAEIISKKSDERRNIFEEAAGISKYRHRKEESERKLKATQDNIDRHKDILSVLESRVGPLEKDAEKAKKGLAIYEEKKRADVALWLYDTEKIKTDIDEADKAFKLSRHELEIIDQIIEDLERQQDSLTEKSQSNRALSEELLNKIRATETRLNQLSNEISLAESNFRHSAEFIEQRKSRIREIEASKSTLEKTRAEYEAKKSEADAEFKKYSDERLEFLATKQELTIQVEKLSKMLTDALDELTVEENSANDLMVRINVLKNSKISDGSKSQDIEKEIEKYENEGTTLKAEAERCEMNASGFKAKIAEKDEIINSSNEKIDELSAKRDSDNKELNELTLKQDTLIQRAEVLTQMNEHFEGYNDSIKFVMKESRAGNIKGDIYGPLSSLINVDKEYITAIETALGGSLHNIVVKDEEAAKAAIRALKSANAGRATFYPVSAVKPAGETEEIKACAKLEGYVGRADTLVRSLDTYRPVVELLLLRTVIFDNLENASAAAKKLQYKVKLVTLDGQQINAGAAFTGGSAKKESGLLSRLAEIETLKEKGKALDKKIASLKKSISETQKSINEIKNKLKEAEQEKELLLSLSRSQFAALDTANANYNANRNFLEKLRYDYNNLTGQQTKAEEEIVRLTAEHAANLERIAALKEFRSKKSEEMGVLDEKSDECSDKANALFIKMTAAEKDSDGMQAFINDVNERITALDGERDSELSKIEELNRRRNSYNDENKERSDESRRLEEELKELNSERRDVESGSDEYEKALADIRIKSKERNNSRQVIYESVIRNENRLNKLEEDRDKLGSQLWDEYSITYDEAVALQYPPVTEENREEIAKVQSSCKARLRALGNYNPDAIEEYARVKTEYDTYMTQYNDLTNSYNQLLEIISRLEEEMKTSFVTAFQNINRNFGITFRELFGGGNAELLLVDPEDVLNSGIEIKAAPPGKIIKNLALLSGGEQSFVAIALLFAILKVNPTPFCILDEIEAALDEVNVFRFGDYIKKFDDGTQFILITHRRGTMEIGDRLYGVTMPQRGISQAIALDVNEIEGKQKELLDGVL